MNTSEQIDKIAAALAKAQGEMGKASKDSVNPHFKNKYADLASVMTACIGALTSNGIAVLQAPGSEAGEVSVTTRLLHSSGQWLESTASCRPGKPDAQAMGSVITYLRRYSLAAMTGVVADDDDDGNAASIGPSNKTNVFGGAGPHSMSPQSPPAPRQAPKSSAKASPATNGKSAASEAPSELNDPIPFGEDGGQVSYVDGRGGKHPMDLADGVNRLEQAAEARDSLNDEAFAAVMWRNEWCQERAPAAWRALWASRKMIADEWMPA